MLAVILVCLIWVVPASAAVYGTVRGGWLALSVAVSLLVLLAGLAAFRHTEHDFIDTV